MDIWDINYVNKTGKTFMYRWNKGGAFIRPNGNLNHYSKDQGVTKAVR